MTLNIERLGNEHREEKREKRQMDNRDEVDPVTADQLRTMGEGCFEHAAELERYKRERQRSERSLTLVDAESGNTRGEHTDG